MLLSSCCPFTIFVKSLFPCQQSPECMILCGVRIKVLHLQETCSLPDQFVFITCFPKPRFLMGEPQIRMWGHNVSGATNLLATIPGINFTGTCKERFSPLSCVNQISLSTTVTSTTVSTLPTVSNTIPVSCCNCFCLVLGCSY